MEEKEKEKMFRRIGTLMTYKDKPRGQNDVFGYILYGQLFVYKTSFDLLLFNL